MPTPGRLATFVAFNQTRNAMKTNRILRIGFGGLLGVVGLNHLFHFFATPAYTGRAAEVYGAFASSGYVLPAVGITMLLTATALLTNRVVMVGLLLLVPVLVNMLLFHLVLAPAGVAPALVLSAVTGYLLFTQRRTSPLTATPDSRIP